MKIYLTRTPMDSENNKVFYTNPVEASQASLRIDKYIAGEIRDFSRAQVQRLIEEGFVFADDEVILDKNHKTRIGDVYQVNLPEPKEAAPQAENIPLDILYEDSDLIVVNKPAGMTVHPAAGVYTGTLVNAVLYHCRASLSGIGGVARPGIVHRIDRNTSGILVAAKNDIAHRGLAEQFFYHTIERTYYAVVYGIPLAGRVPRDGPCQTVVSVFPSHNQIPEKAYKYFLYSVFILNFIIIFTLNF